MIKANLISRNINNALEKIICEKTIREGEFRVAFTSNFIPVIKFPLYVSDTSVDLKGDEQYAVEYEYSLYSMLVNNSNTPFKEPELEVVTLLDVRITSLERYFFAEEAVKMALRALKGASLDAIRAWANTYDTLEECTEDEIVMAEMAMGDDETVRDAYNRALSLIA